MLSSLFPPRNLKFEQHQEVATLKFQLAYVGFLALAAGLYELGVCLWPKICPRIAILIPLSCSIIARTVCLCLGRWWKRMPIFQAAAFLLVLDTGLISCWRPDVFIRGLVGSWSSPFSVDTSDLAAEIKGLVQSAMSPQALMLTASNLSTVDMTSMADLSSLQVALSPQQLALKLEMMLDQWLDDSGPSETPSNSIFTFRFVVVVYLFQIMMWYNVTFVLLLRHTVPALIMSLAVMVTIVLTFGIIQARWTSILMELSLELFTMILVLATKVHVEKSQRILYTTAERTKEEAIKEQVLRQQAQSAEEEMRGNLKRQSTTGCGHPDAAVLPPDAVYSRPKRVKRPSCNSAPAAPSAIAEERTTADCLLPDSLVWVQGRPLPCKVSEVEPGQNVLCYDTISGCLAFSEVAKTQTLEGATKWVNVRLADGTALMLTADHPVHSAAPFERTVSRVARAGQLRPGVDAVTVLRMAPVPVVEVLREESKEQMGGQISRVAVTIRQPERHSIFVGAGDLHGAPMAPIAIGSADAFRNSSPARAQLQVQHTFLSVKDPDEVVPRPRSNSDPTGLKGWPVLQALPFEPLGGSCTPMKRTRVAVRSHSDSDLSSERTPGSRGVGDQSRGQQPSIPSSKRPALRSAQMSRAS